MAAIWLALADLQNAFSTAAITAIFDDQNTGTPNAQSVNMLIDEAEQEVMSWLVDELGPPPLSAALMTQLAADTFLKYAALDYARALVVDKHPEYFRSKPEDVKARFKRADDRMERILDARQRPPTVPTKPANVGGVSVDNANRIYIDSPGGGLNSGDYAMLELDPFSDLDRMRRLPIVP